MTSYLVGKRYQLLNVVGAGAMGHVFRALDRLTGRVVALKRLTAAAAQLQFSAREQHAFENARLALAREFQILASLRHPNIIRVLDYGFHQEAPDQEPLPFLTMDLLENAQPIKDAAAGQPLSLKLDLLAQVLQALIYLHRRDVLHRDLKPGNILVLDGRVKVVDFGIALRRGEHKTAAGTLAYIAPEVLAGTEASEASDLYAIGMIAYEILAGGYPFPLDDMPELLRAVREDMPDVNALEVEPALQLVISQLLQKDPAARYLTARATLDALAEATTVSVTLETAATRESFLQAATFVGRVHELQTLTAALGNAASRQQGELILVAGETGVGKSRLLDELRTQALVDGALVLTGYAASAGSNFYELWREPLRWLALTSDLTPEDASLFKMVVPDVGYLLGRRVPDPPPVAPEVAQTRLLAAIASLFCRQFIAPVGDGPGSSEGPETAPAPGPLLLILEDLHWAGDESLDALDHLLAVAATLPLLIVGSFRDDERPALPARYPAAPLLKLPRLDATSIAQLCAAMLGPRGEQPGLQRFLRQQTEGNAFFLVEVVRALAEAAGELEAIDPAALPDHISTGRLAEYVQRRLGHVPPNAQALLTLAAVGGRRLDLDVLARLAAGQDVELWLAACANAAVLEHASDQWVFAHERLRDGILERLPDDVRGTLHAEYATAVEAAYELQVDYQAASLAYHWREAAQVTKEAHYAAKAGEQALQHGATREALSFLERALQLHAQEKLPANPRHIALLHRLAGDACFARRAYDDAAQHYAASLSDAQAAKYRWGIALAHGSLGRAAFARQQHDAARTHFTEALHTCREARATQVTLSVLVGAAALLAHDGDPATAISLLGLVLAHPAADKDALDAATRLYDELAAESGAATATQARDRYQDHRLDDVVNDVLARWSA